MHSLARTASLLSIIIIECCVGHFAPAIAGERSGDVLMSKIDSTTIRSQSLASYLDQLGKKSRVYFAVEDEIARVSNAMVRLRLSDSIISIDVPATTLADHMSHVSGALPGCSWTTSAEVIWIRRSDVTNSALDTKVDLFNQTGQIWRVLSKLKKFDQRIPDGYAYNTRQTVDEWTYPVVVSESNSTIMACMSAALRQGPKPGLVFRLIHFVPTVDIPWFRGSTNVADAAEACAFQIGSTWSEAPDRNY